jgi:hypothetical protein
MTRLLAVSALGLLLITNGCSDSMGMHVSGDGGLDAWVGGSGGTGGAAGTGGEGGIASGGQGGSAGATGECANSPTAGATGTADCGTAVVRKSCYPRVYGDYFCNSDVYVVSCSYNPVTGCLCADDNVSPCEPLDPKCTGPTVGDKAYLDKKDPSTNVSCYCDSIGYWWCF